MCEHNNKIGDNYGLSCRDCGEQLQGYGYWGKHKTCIHFWYKDDEGRETCMYCERTKEMIEEQRA